MLVFAATFSTPEYVRGEGGTTPPEIIRGCLHQLQTPRFEEDIPQVLILLELLLEAAVHHLELAPFPLRRGSKLGPHLFNESLVPRKIDFRSCKVLVHGFGVDEVVGLLGAEEGVMTNPK